jgi:hypothetical protein
LLARFPVIVYAAATMRHKLLIAVLVACVSACAPKLGDGCKRNTDCSVQGNRTCDLAQPGGYCTIPNCSPDSCGSQGRCVRWQPDEPRLSMNWCMARCKNSGDCKRHHYVCRSAEQLNEAAAQVDAGMIPEGDAAVPDAGVPFVPRVAEVVDTKDGKFCVVNE